MGVAGPRSDENWMLPVKHKEQVLQEALQTVTGPNVGVTDQWIIFPATTLRVFLFLSSQTGLVPGMHQHQP
jgi:hypothetical protein